MNELLNRLATNTANGNKAGTEGKDDEPKKGIDNFLMVIQEGKEYYSKIIHMIAEGWSEAEMEEYAARPQSVSK